MEKYWSREISGRRGRRRRVRFHAETQRLRKGAKKSMQDSNAIVVDDLHKSYGPTQAVRGISFTVNRGEIFGMIGPDGAGKTTTFQILAGVMEATSGTATIFGQPARAMRAQTGYLTQTFSLYPDLSVTENLRYIGDLRRVPPQQIAERG